MLEIKSDWETFGHLRIKNILNKQLALGQFPNAYLFIGASEIGKKTLALELAKKILNSANLANHPDFVMLDQEAEISVESILDFITKLNFRPFVAKYKVAIINNAENLNTNSSNALLKTLEEPSESTIIILISSNAKLLPTIVSRCQVLKFSNASSQELEEFVKKNNYTLDSKILELCFGKIGSLVNLVNNIELKNKQNEIIDSYKSFFKKNLSEKLLAVNEYSEYDSEDLTYNLNLWLNWQLQNVSKEPRNYSKLQVLLDSLQSLKMNKNKKLILQELFLKL